MAMKGFMSMLAASKNPRAAFSFVNEKFKQIYAEMFPPEEADQEMAKLLQDLTGAKEVEEEDTGPKETEAQRAKRLWLAAQPKPVKHADAVLITMTFLADPPPMYTLRPPKSWQDDLVEAEAILRHQQKLTKEDVTTKVYTMLPQVLEQINDLLATMGRDAIEIDEQYYETEIIRLEKEKKRRRPLKPWESRRFVSPPPRKPKKPWFRLSSDEKEKAEEELSELEARDKSREEELLKLLQDTPADSLDNNQLRANVQLEIEEVRKRIQGRQAQADAAANIVPETALISTPILEPAAASVDTTGPVSAPTPGPVAGVDFLSDTTGPAVGPAVPADSEHAQAPAPSSPDRPGKTLHMPKLGPLPPMELYVPTTEEIKTKLRAVPQDVADRIKRMPGEVREKVRKIVKELQEPRIIKNVHDTSERKIFESMLIRELAEAVYLPVENIKIEEIRRLQKNDPKIFALQQRNKERAEALAEKRRQQHLAYEADRARRKALMASDEEHFMVEAMREFVEEQSEQWGVDIEKTFGMKKTVYSVLPSRLQKQQMLAIENGTLEPAVTFEREVLLLQDAERAISDIQPVEGANASIEAFPDPSSSPVDAQGSTLQLSQLRSQVGSQSQSQSLSAGAQPSSSVELCDGSQQLIIDWAADSVGSGSAAKSVQILEAGDQASLMSGRIGEKGFGGSSVSSQTLMEWTSSRVVCPPEVISEEEIMRLNRQREDRLGLYDEEIVNLMEYMVAEVYSSVYLEQQIAKDEEAFRLMGIPESKQITTGSTMPEYFKLGVRNPEILRYDPNYWLAKSIRPASKTELRDRRLRRLQMSIKKEGLELRLQQLQHLRDTLIYDAVEYYDENIEPIVERVLKPFARRMHALLRAKLKEYGQYMNNVALEAKQKLLEKLQEGLLSLKPPADEALAIEDAPVLISMVEMRAQYAERWREKALRRCKELHDAEPIDPSAMASLPPPLVKTSSSSDDTGSSVASYVPPKKERPGMAVVLCLECLTTEVERRQCAQEELAQQNKQVEAGRDRVQRVARGFSDGAAAKGPQPVPAEHEGPEESPESLAHWAELVACVDFLSGEAARRVAAVFSEDDMRAIEGDAELGLQYFPTEVQVGVVLRECVEFIATRHEREDEDALAIAWMELSKQRAEIVAILEEFKRMEAEKEAAIAAAQDKFDMAPGANSKLSAEEERALVEAEEKNISAELQALRDAQAKQKAEDDLRAKFRRLRRQRRRVYDNDVVDLLNKMCIAVEIAAEFGEQPLDLLPEIEDDYDLDAGKAETESTPGTPRDLMTPRPGSAAGESGALVRDGVLDAAEGDAAEPEEEEEPVLGCEVSFIVYISENERAAEGLADLEAEDVAIMLLRQLEEPTSQLRSGYLGQRLLDVQYKLPFKKKLFATWESFWVHIIHPVFFYRTSGKSVPAKEKDNGGRLESGLVMVNPTSAFSLRSKDTFMLYQRKYLKKPKAKRAGAGPDNAEEEALKAQIAAKAAAKKAKQTSVVDLNVDEFAGDVKALQIVRPNMSAITSKDVERMRRIAGAFDDEYKKEIAKGLVDGCRLASSQYLALKNRDTAWRIYTNCKAKLSQVMRKENMGDDESDLHPIMKTTRILPETFEGWMEELRKEQTNNLRELCAKKAADRELRDQEMALRRHFVKQRYWIINDKINRHLNGAEVGPALHKEINDFAELKHRAIINDLNDDEKAKYQMKANKLQAGFITEEKYTRNIFDVIKAWVMRKNRKMRSQRLKGMQINRKRQDSALYTAMYLGLQGLDLSAVNALWEKAETAEKAAEVLDVIYEDTESDSDSKEEEEEEDDKTEATEASEAGEEEDGDAKSQQSGSSKPDTPQNPTQPVKRSRKKKGKKDGEDVTVVPFIYREELMSFIEVFNVQVQHAQAMKENDMRELAEVQDLVRQRKQSMAVMGQTSGLSEKAEIRAELERRKSVMPALLLQNANEITGEAGPATYIPAGRRRQSLKEVLKAAPDRRLSALANAEASKSAITRIDEAGLALLPEELELCKEIEWFQTIREDDDFYQTLQHLPLQDANKMARDELIQFATVLREIVPVIKRVEKRLQAEKEAALIAAGFRGKKDMAAAAGISAKEQKRLEREAALLERQKKFPLTPEQLEKKQAADLAEALAAGMNEEGIRRMKRADEALKRQAGREKAWLMAHPHRFIKYPGQPAFCIACKEKEYDVWLEGFCQAEADQVGVFTEDMMDNMEDYSPTAEAEYQAETAERLAKIELDLKDSYKYETSKLRAEKEYEVLRKAYDKAVRAQKKNGGPAPVKPMKPYIKPYDYENTEMKRWRVRRIVETHFTELKQSIPDGLWLSGLPLVDPDGDSVLPPPPDDEGEVAESSDDEDAAHGHEGKGLKIRVWQKDGPGLKGAFLGMTHIREAEVLDPPKGMRTYPLRMDTYVLKRLEKEGRQAISITGSITLMLKVTKFDHQTRVQKAANEDKIPRNWRLEIMRASRLACADRLKGTTAYCEVFWMGPAIKDGLEEDYGGKWLGVGETKEKPKSENPTWDREDFSMYDLPPIWTELPIKGRGPGGTNLTGGGWVAANNVPMPLDVSKTMAAQGRLSRRRLRAVMLAALGVIKILRARREAQRIEVKRKIDTKREFWLAEERERKCMAREEKIARKVYIEQAIHQAQPLLIKQLDYEREYSRLVQYIKEPPKILARLRFMMGSNSDGGGLITMCEDPATHRLLNVISVPILYPEDEEDLCWQMQRLIGKQNPNITQIIDFSVHAVRLFAQSGFPGIDQRIALAVLERYEGQPFLEYIQEDWQILTNDEFRLLLAQIINGLDELHAEGIIHRNFHEKCIIVRRPMHIIAEENAMGRHPANPPKIPNLRIGEFWFLNNPRRSGCRYSLGRADWGAKSTMPPEAISGGIIDDKSDIYAFGMCVYHWATAGRILPASFSLDDLKSHLPLKWTAWVHALLRMCLHLNPKARASAAEIKRFLSARAICREAR